ncbi:hypothetical protein [Streptomyces halstedii]|uniref:hypothetical protein n=1 Tax=Streptomyces halstedii TaxID=1944 RepID=UPI0036AB59A6
MGLVSGVVQLRPEEAMFDAMLRGWRAQQKSRGLKDETIDPRERLVRRFLEFVNEYPWQWTPAHLDEWSATLTSEKHLAPSTIRSYQGTIRLFTDLLVDARYGWGRACEEAFGTFPVAVCHEWNTLPHLQDYEGDPEDEAVHQGRVAAFPRLHRRPGRTRREAEARGGLAAVHAARPSMIRIMQLKDVDLGNRRTTVGGHVRLLDDLTRRAVLDWLSHRHSRWPNTANSHLLITQKTAVELGQLASSGPPGPPATSPPVWNGSALTVSSKRPSPIAPTPSTSHSSSASTRRPPSATRAQHERFWAKKPSRHRNETHSTRSTH